MMQYLLGKKRGTRPKRKSTQCGGLTNGAEAQFLPVTLKGRKITHRRAYGLFEQQHHRAGFGQRDAQTAQSYF